MTTTEKVRRVGVTRQTVAPWIREKKLLARRIEVGAVYRMRAEDYRRFVRRYVKDDWS